MDNTMASILSRAVGIQGRGMNLVIFAIIFWLWAFSLILSRMYFRRKHAKPIGLDDMAIMFSILFSLVLSVLSCVAVHYGYGKPSNSLKLEDLHTSLLMFYLIQIFYKITIACTKISILLLYLRIFPGKTFRSLDYLLLFYVIGYAIGSILATIFQCEPIHGAWIHSLPRKCTNVKVSWYVNGGADMLGDLMILLLPMSLIYKLHLPIRERLGLVLIFALGGFVCATAAVRMVALKLGSKALDINHGTLPSTIWTIVEANTGIICACLPMLKTPLAKLFPSLFPFSSTTSGGSNTRSRHQAHTGNYAAWEHFDQAHQELVAQPDRSVRTPTRNNSNSEDLESNSILKTTNINVEYTEHGYPLGSLPQYNSSHGGPTSPLPANVGRIGPNGKAIGTTHSPF